MFCLSKSWSKASVIEEKAASLHVRIGLFCAFFSGYVTRQSLHGGCTGSVTP
jgi:hypothetical protein